MLSKVQLEVFRLFYLHYRHTNEPMRLDHRPIKAKLPTISKLQAEGYIANGQNNIYAPFWLTNEGWALGEKLFNEDYQRYAAEQTQIDELNQQLIARFAPGIPNVKSIRQDAKGFYRVWFENDMTINPDGEGGYRITIPQMWMVKSGDAYMLTHQIRDAVWIIKRMESGEC